MTSGKCPKCNSEKIIPILYGLPTEAAMKAAHKGEIALGGCIIDDDQPQWHCSDCKYQWGGER